MAVERSGDVAARVLVRFPKIRESLRLIRKIVSEMPQGSIRNEIRSKPNKCGFGWIEGWRGDILVALETGVAIATIRPGRTGRRLSTRLSITSCLIFR